MNLALFDQFESQTLIGFPLIIIALLLPLLLLPKSAHNWLNSRLGTTQSWLLFNAVKQLFQPVNQTGHKWAILYLSLITYLLFINISGLLPYTFTPTTQLSLNMALAVPFWLATVLLGMRTQPSTALGHLLPEGTPTPLIPILIIIETISLFIRPLALGVRLTANLTAGHLLIQLFATAAYTLLSMAPLAFAAMTLILFLLTLLEIAVAMIQAYVFVLLLTLYLQENL
uniref:ATP synthase subunit a n=1 Tax=Leptobrachella oshanensis TaxID=2769484 RepID=M1RV14_LEPOH|nr:ATP synthase F0 subunit 6 [Leptobrachella oshanensis]AGG15985.1 ATP synthase F0 subunit 6 [Leptobrachella oshanensis]